MAAREPIRPPELSELETFVLAVDEGSMAQAASRLRISTQAAAKRIRQLEVLARTPLLVRGHRGVTPTDTGARLYPAARDLLAQRERVIGALAGALPADPLRIAGLHQLLARAPAPPADEALKAAEALLAAVFHAGADAMILARAHDGLIDEVNDAAVRLLGYDQVEMRGRTVTQLRLFEDGEAGEAWVRAAVASRRPQGRSLVARTRSDAARRVTARCEALELHGVVHVLITLREAGGTRSPAPIAAVPEAADGVDDPLRRRFLAALRGGQVDEAQAVGDEAVDRGAGLATIHSQLIEPAMRSIGELWERGEITVADEHLATSICQALAARLAGQRDRSSSGSRVMLAAVQGEQHVLGLRLVADVLEGAGYDVLYLGADVPLAALVDACRVHGPDVLGFTVTLWHNVPTLIWEIEEVSRLEHPPRVMIGGRAVHSAHRGLSAPVVAHADRVLEATEQLLRSKTPAARP